MKKTSGPLRRCSLPSEHAGSSKGENRMTDSMTWTREPKKYSVTPERIEITTEPHTDLW